MESYTVKQVAELLSTNEETVRRWIRSGKLGASLASKKSGHIITADALNHFLKTTPKYASALTASVASSPFAISVIVGGLLGSMFAMVEGNKHITAKDVENFLRKKIKGHSQTIEKKENQLQKLKAEIAEERQNLEKYQYALDNLDLNVIAENVNAERHNK